MVTMEMILIVCTAVITFVAGELAKKFEWFATESIPLQNFLIGILAGLLAYVCGLEPNLIQAIIMCLSASMCAGGTYDAIKRK